MFECLLGNEKTFAILRNMLINDRLPHAIVLEGEKGLGKRTAVREFSKAVLCEDSNEYCGKCRNCTLFSAGTHPDYSVISPSGKTNIISVEDIHTMRKNVYIKPDRAKYKIIVIEDADRMHTVSQNALLKILEEPPEYVLFILLCESSEKLLETIISRCTVLRMTPPPQSDAEELLAKRFPMQDPKNIERILLSADGNIGRAEYLLDSEGVGASIAEDVEKFFTCISLHRSYDVLKTVTKYAGDTKAFLTFSDLLESRASGCLRRASLGMSPEFALSKKQLMGIIEKTKEIRELLYNKRADNLLLTCFCASLCDL